MAAGAPAQTLPLRCQGCSNSTSYQRHGDEAHLAPTPPTACRLPAGGAPDGIGRATLFRLNAPGRALPTASTPLCVNAGSEGSLSERYTRALVKLTNAVWHPDCTFDTALGLICETAADALRVERVNAWRYDAEHNRLECRHAFSRSTREHAVGDGERWLPLDGNCYSASLHEVRAIDAADVESDPSTADAVGALRMYLRRHGIQALLDAPVRIEGELLGVICHEHVGSPRQWSCEETTFAGSMGDYVAMAYQIARRHEAEQAVQHLRLHDAGTDLPNRDYMVELLGQRLSLAQLPGPATAVLHVRVDTGHGTALSPDAPTLDEVMALVARCLLAMAARQPPQQAFHLARVRTDAFALLPPRGARQPDVVQLAEACIAAVRALPRPHEEIEIGVAVGIAFALPGDGGARVLMRKAEQAADRARIQGGGRFEVFDIEHHQGLVERLRGERALRDAFARGRLELHYQPEYDLQRAGWCGAEALLRWHAGLVVRPRDGTGKAARAAGCAGYSLVTRPRSGMQLATAGATLPRVPQRAGCGLSTRSGPGLQATPNTVATAPVTGPTGSVPIA